MQAKIKLIIVDDVQMTRFDLWLKFRKIDNVEIIAEAENGQLFLDLLSSHKPDVVLMDIMMPVMDGLEATKRALAKNPFLKIIAFTTDDEESTLDKMILSGAKGFLLKSANVSEIQKAIETVMTGSTYISSGLVRLVKN